MCALSRLVCLKWFAKLKTILEQKGYARSRRENTSTTHSMVTNFNSSTRYRRRQETKDVLEFIHGGREGSVYGAWDYFSSAASKQTFDNLIAGYKRGKYLEGLFEKAAIDYRNSDEALKQAVMIKYENFLSRRKYTLACRTQTSVFDPNAEVWLPRNVKCLDVNLRIPDLSVSNSKVDKFVKELDIGEVNQIPSVPGVARTVTGLVFMIMDLHLRLPHLHKKLIWFNENEHHFIFQFSDDGAPESSLSTMSIGSLTAWNFGERVRSRDFHYLLHCVSLEEKNEVLKDLWCQHTEEMQLLEGNIFDVCGKQCTMEFTPSADMSWQSWSNNEVNQAATYPSPYANVCKDTMNTIGGTIGENDEDTWKPYTKKIREEHADKVSNYIESLPPNLAEEQKHKKLLKFMAENGIRQLGTPIIRNYAEKQRPEPIHCEINAWQNVLNIIYMQYVERGRFPKLIEVLSAPKANSTGSSPTLGCGLGYLVSKIKEHYGNESDRYNKLPVRLIGDQAIALANYSYRLIDGLEFVEESPAQKLTRIALGKIAEYLRNIGILINKIDTSPDYLVNLRENCTGYFNIFALFFPSSINVTVWTIGYAIPYHATKLFMTYKIGYGIISMQAKEAKHASIKKDLLLTNRSLKVTQNGKWWQLMRANYVRAFYLPEHHPIPCAGTHHYKSRIPPHVKEGGEFCDCGREKETQDNSTCKVCDLSTVIIECSDKGELLPSVVEIFKPIVCPTCNERFADHACLETHMKVHTDNVVSCKGIHPHSMKLNDLKKEMKSRGLSISGNKDTLVRRLETYLATL